ncbi:MAG: hypothetical protein WC599_04075 [Bacteroidales bacterium]
MKKVYLLTIAVIVTCAITLLVSFKTDTKVKYNFLQISTIESVVPGGLGRSRMISSNPDGTVNEEKMENFFSMAGINFGNVRKNDQQITDKINTIVNDGWEFVSVSTGVYPGGSGDKGGTGATGIFITRYLFKKTAN